MENNKEQVGKALGLVPSGLFILTAHHDGCDGAALVSWAGQCAFAPPSVTVMLAPNRPVLALAEGARAFILNVIGKDPRNLLKRFGKPPQEPGGLFAGLGIRRGRKNSAILNDAIAYLECELTQQVPIGDHVLCVGEITGGGLLQAGEEPYVHTRASGFSY